MDMWLHVSAITWSSSGNCNFGFYMSKWPEDEQVMVETCNHEQQEGTHDNNTNKVQPHAQIKL
jgi:hypothetical protein